MVDVSHMTSLFENATEGIILTDSSGKIVLINPAIERIFGYKLEEISGKPIETLVPDRYTHHHAELRNDFYKQPENRVMGHNRDLNAKKKDGSDIPVEVSLSHYKKDNELFVIAFIIDITQRKKIEKDILHQKKELETISREMRNLNTELEAKVEERTAILQEALQRLEQSQTELSEALDKERQLNEIKSRFVSMASHEFRTPLSTVLSSASLISKYSHTQDQDKRDRHIKKIKNSVKQLNDILEDFLSLGKLDEGKVLVKSNEFDLEEFIFDTADDMKGLLKRDQKIICKHSGIKESLSDSKLLKNVLINLISNAIKFSDEGKDIEIRSIGKEDEMSIEICDKGIGISEEDQKHLFSSFFRGANALNINGTGLGLHIVKRYVNILGGSISLQSQLNIGTSINIIIPKK